MKKKAVSLFVCALALCLCACGHVRNAVVPAYDSELYTTREIDAAIDAAKQYFRKEFSGCTLTRITYAGDETTTVHASWAQRHDADEVIVLTSDFDVDASGGDGSLNPNSTYTNWMWILVRENGGSWRHADHGY